MRHGNQHGMSSYKWVLNRLNNSRIPNMASHWHLRNDDLNNSRCYDAFCGFKESQFVGSYQVDRNWCHLVVQQAKALQYCHPSAICRSIFGSDVGTSNSGLLGPLSSHDITATHSKAANNGVRGPIYALAYFRDTWHGFSMLELKCVVIKIHFIWGSRPKIIIQLIILLSYFYTDASYEKVDGGYGYGKVVRKLFILSSEPVTHHILFMIFCQ